MKKIFLFLLVIMWAIPAYSVQQTITSGAGTEHQWSVQKNRINNNFDDLYTQAATHWIPSGHTYTADIDTVTHGGKIYICTTTHNSSAAGVAGNEPGVGGNWLDVWKPIDASGLGLGTTNNVTFGNVNASGGTLSAGVANTTQGALLLYSNTDPIYSFGLTPAASPTAIVSLKAPPAMPGGSNYLLNFDADGTGGWTDPASIGGSSTLGALTDVTGEGTIDYMLYDDGDGTFSFRAAPSGTMTWPSTAGIVGWTSGTTWDHYTLDTDLSTVSTSDDSIPSAKAVDATYQKISGMEFVDVDGTTIEKASGDGSESTPWLLGVKSGVFQPLLTNPIVQDNLGTGVYIFLGTPSIANFFTALTGEGSFAATLLGYDNAAAVRAGLDLEPGTDFYSTTAVNDAITVAEFQSLAVSDLSDSTSPHVLTTAETTSKIISSYSAGSTDKSFEFGSAHAKLNVIFGIGDAYQLDLIPPSGTAFYLNGTEMASDEHIVNSADTVGEQMVCFSMVISGSQRIMCESKYTDFAEATP